MDTYFKDKKVTVMRIGLLGRGIGDTAYLAEAGALVTVVDAAPQDVMQPAVDALKQYKNITWKFGPYDFADFKDADMVLMGAGTPLDEPVLRKCHEAGVPVRQSAALFAELSGVPIIGVTGTRGKSTVTHMIHHVLEAITGEKVLLGGNIRGVSNLQLLNDVTEDSLCVMELDSWQLQGWGWVQRSPDIAVFTNFMPDHLNYYQIPGSSEAEALKVYFADKANIFRYQDASGVLVTTPEVFSKAQEYAKELHITLGQEVVLADVSSLPEDGLLAMPGEHNRLNAALAFEALKAMSLEEEEIFAALSSFAGVEGRLQYCGLVGDIGVYNDNNATTPQATVEGLKAVGSPEQKNIILIAGGADKGLDVAPLAYTITQYCSQVVLVPGTGTDRLVELLHNGTVGVSVVSDLKQAVDTALQSATPGSIVLFSPAFASFGLFKNEYERNDMFINQLQKKQTESEVE